MTYPIDGPTLVISGCSGVEIDYCPDCRGVWLDRGELDKIIDRSVGTDAPAPQQDRRDMRPRKKRDSFLSEIFDF